MAQRKGAGRDAGRFDGFERDPSKAASNARKHGVRFEGAMTVFDDANAAARFDEDHAEVEERWVIIGLTGRSGG